jgi:hypothetical protein
MFHDFRFIAILFIGYIGARVDEHFKRGVPRQNSIRVENSGFKLKSILLFGVIA